MPAFRRSLERPLKSALAPPFASQTLTQRSCSLLYHSCLKQLIFIIRTGAAGRISAISLSRSHFGVHCVSSPLRHRHSLAKIDVLLEKFNFLTRDKYNSFVKREISVCNLERKFYPLNLPKRRRTKSYFLYKKNNGRCPEYPIALSLAYFIFLHGYNFSRMK